MNPIRCLIVDDEPPAIDLLVRYTSMVDRLEVVGTCLSAVKAFDMLKEIEVDLLFIDIRMPVLSGLDFIKVLKNPPAIIITTAYREYALDGYDLDIVDYLLKPIPFDRFLKAVDRYTDRNQRQSRGTVSNNKVELEIDHIYFNVNKTHYKVLISEIVYVESLKDYVKIHTVDNHLVVKGNIGSIMKQLPSIGFLRIHRSFGIAIGHLSSYNHSEVEVGGKRLPIGVSYKEEVVRILKC